MRSPVMTTIELNRQLASLIFAERRAWRKMMNGTELDARTVKGEEGANYLAWGIAADANRKFLDDNKEHIIEESRFY